MPVTLEDIFLAAVEKPPADRVAYLDAACGTDTKLRAEVEALLRSHDEAGSMLEQPLFRPGPTVDETPVVQRPGTVIGPYKLIEPIGEGGMGTVWMAQQTEPVKRLVAVKLVKAGMDSKQVIARFEAERQALALMDHPNIARVLDAGTTSAGRPYFVMDLVKGVPITRYCDEHRLTPRQRLELFIPVCQAVQHAHQKGIIHRDLKPSNVLVALYDDKPVPKVIDFGVAKAAGQTLTDKTLVTGFGNIVGTLEYMSPEQAEVNQLDIDTRSDIYSLGVLLYELLAGSPPFSRKGLEKAGMLEMLRVIREQEPSKPSTKLSTADGLPTLAANRGTEPAKLTRLVRGELDWIVMKALEKDRGRRYETANGFAMDVQRYLADDPVLACPPSAGYRLKKFARRNKGRLSVAAVLGTALLVAVAVIGWAVRDRAAREQAAAKDRQDREQRLTAQVELILDEVDRLEREQRWPEAQAAAERAEAALDGGEADDAARRRVADVRRDLAFLARLDRIRQQRATTIEGQFNHAGAAREYVLAFRDYGVDVEGLPPDMAVGRLLAKPVLALPVASALDDWVEARQNLGEDAPSWKPLVAVARALDSDRLRDRLRTSSGQPITPDSQDDLRRLAEAIDVKVQSPASIQFLATTLMRSNLPELAIRILRDGQYAYPSDFWLNSKLGAAFGVRKDHASAARYCSAAVSIRPDSSVAHNNLGNALHDGGKFEEAIAEYHKAIELDPKFAPAHDNLGLALGKQGKWDAAMAEHRKAIELAPEFAAAYNNLGIALSNQKKLDEAIAAYRKAIRLKSDITEARINLGDALRATGQLDDAIAQYRELLKLMKELRKNAADVHCHLGFALAGKGLLDEAIDEYQETVRLLKDLPKDRSADGLYWHGIALEAHQGLAGALGHKGRHREAMAEIREAVRISRNDPQMLNYLAWLLATCPDTSLRDASEAVRLARQAVELAPKESNYWNTLGVAHYRAGDWPAARTALEKSMELRKGGDPFDWLFLAMAHWRLNQMDEARKRYDQAVQWMEKHEPQDDELRRFRREAEELLEIKKKEK
jgi:serine/threonine protein kinase/tetratricopeptide (TPR) repeat protein